MSNLLEQAISFLDKSNQYSSDTEFNLLSEELDVIEEASWEDKHDINNQDKPKVDTKTAAAVGAAGAVAVSAITAGIIDLYRKAHNVTAEQIKGCSGNRKCVLRAYLDGTRKKIQILQRAKSKDSQHASKYDIRIAKLNVTVTQYQNKISSIKAK